MAAILSRLGKRGYAVAEEPSNYGIDPDPDPDFDFDFDFDFDEMKSQQALYSTRTCRASELGR